MTAPTGWEARALALNTRLLEAEEIMETVLEAFENITPKHLYRKGCFNGEIPYTDRKRECPCTAHLITRWIDDDDDAEGQRLLRKQDGA